MPLPAAQVAMTPRRAARRVEELVKTLGSVCGAAAATHLPKGVWEKEAGVLEEHSVCMVTVQLLRTVMSPFTWMMVCHPPLCPLTGHLAAQIQSTGVLVAVWEGERTAGTLREAAAVTVGEAPRVQSVETIVSEVHTCLSSLLSRPATAQWT